MKYFTDLIFWKKNSLRKTRTLSKVMHIMASDTSKDLNSGRFNQSHHFVFLVHDSLSGNSYENTSPKTNRQRLALDGEDGNSSSESSLAIMPLLRVQSTPWNRDHVP